ncbi:DinB family protein [Winogradskyella litorisediminis]|uniref:DinB family protein n=1 Tax=Winogradskyella litorisediminis TaxID=1156618 RepID=A0ABW3NBH1_9FLAO
MQTLKHSLTILCIAVFSISYSQYDVKPPKGYTQDIGNMVSMLDGLKERVTQIVENMDQKSTDFLLDEDANTPGAMIYHLAATEKYYQVYTFEGRQFNAEEQEKWGTALSLGEKAREEFVGKPISYYLMIYDEVRAKTKELLKTKDDKWFAKNNNGVTNHWAWYHVMEHQANHMGQLALISKRIK